MSEQPLVSIIVPIYNVEKYIVRCIDSLCTQTYPHIEILLIDDGSPDRCGEICDKYARLDSRIRVIHQENGGLPVARNSGIDAAQGDYLMFVDGDDWVRPTFCERALAMVREQGVEMAAFGHTIVCEDPNHPDMPAQIDKDVVTDQPGMYDAEGVLSLILSRKDPHNYSWNKICSRRLFEKIRFPKGRTYEDMAVTYRLIDLAKRVYLSDEPLYYYLRRSGSISFNTRKPEGIIDRFEINSETLGFIRNHYPSLTALAVKLVAHNAFTWKLWGNKNKYPDMESAVNRFLKNHKSYLSKNRRPFYVIYYNLRPLLPLYLSYLHYRNKKIQK